MRVLWIIPYRMQAVLDKGEVVDRYFNPGNVASDITFLTWREMPTSFDKLQRMCGEATFGVHHMTPRQCLSAILGDHTGNRRPYDLVRSCTRIGGEMAVRMDVPSLISVHADRRRSLDTLPLWARPAFWLESTRQESICRRATKCVITSEGYRHIAPDAEWIPNVVAEPRPRKHPPYYVMCISRDIPGKGFEPMRAAAKKAGKYFGWLGGDNPMSNETVMNMMAAARVVVLRNHYPGCPKTVQEALLTGCRVVLNREALREAPELEAMPILWCDDTVDGYARAIRYAWDGIHFDEVERRIDQARNIWDPATVEARWADAYRETVG